MTDEDVVRYKPLVIACIKRLRFYGETEDLIQVGLEGLVKAHQRFDPERGVAFTTFSTQYIRGAILHYLRDLGHLIRRPRRHGTKWRTVSLDASLDDGPELEDQLGADDQELADADVRIDTERVLGALSARDRFVIEQALLGMSQPRIAQQMGISQAHVSRIFVRARRRVEAMVQNGMLSLSE